MPERIGFFRVGELMVGTTDRHVGGKQTPALIGLDHFDLPITVGLQGTCEVCRERVNTLRIPRWEKGNAGTCEGDGLE